MTGVRHDVVKRLTHLPFALAAMATLLVVAVAMGAFARGGAGAAGAAAGVAVVAASYVISSLVIAWADTVDRNLIMPVGLGTYAVKLVVIGLAMWRIASSGWAGLTPMVFAIVAGVLVWTAAQSVWTYRAKIPYVDPVGEAGASEDRAR